MSASRIPSLAGENCWKPVRYTCLPARVTWEPNVRVVCQLRRPVARWSTSLLLGVFMACLVRVRGCGWHFCPETSTSATAAGMERDAYAAMLHGHACVHMRICKGAHHFVFRCACARWCPCRLPVVCRLNCSSSSDEGLVTGAVADSSVSIQLRHERVRIRGCRQDHSGKESRELLRNDPRRSEHEQA